MCSTKIIVCKFPHSSVWPDDTALADGMWILGGCSSQWNNKALTGKKKNKQTENLYPLTCSCLELEYELLISCGYFVITKHVEKSQHTKDGSAEQEDVVESRSHVQLFCKPVDCRPPGLSVHEIFQPRILEWVAISSFKGYSWPRDGTHVSCTSYIGSRVLYHCTTIGRI